MARKRANGEGSIRKRSNGTWEARIMLGVDPKTGKKISKSLYGKTQKEVRDKLAAFQAGENGEERSVPLPPPVAPKLSLPGNSMYAHGNVNSGYTVNGDYDENMTVSEWLDIFQRDYLADLKPGTAVGYSSVIENHLKPALGNIPLRSLRVPVVQKFYNELRAKGLSPKYIKNIHGILHRALDMAVRVEFLSRNITSLCIIPRVVEEEIQPLDEPELKKLAESMKGSPFENLILTDIFTGLRAGELLGLTWDAIDFDRGILHITKQLVQTRRKGQQYRFGPLKNGKTRIITPAPYVMDVLKKQKADQEKLKSEAGDLWNPGDFPDLVFTHPDGSHFSQPTLWKEFQKLLKDAGIEHHRFHDLRHTYAVNFLRATMDVKTLQVSLGHYSAAFTLDRYGHVVQAMRDESAGKMQNFISKVGLSAPGAENSDAD